jgi:hypothetical protein
MTLAKTIPMNLELESGDELACELTKLAVSKDEECESYSTTYKLTRKGGFRRIEVGDLYDAIKMHFYTRCCCSHDCCGHMNGGAWRINSRRGAVILTTTYTRNC